MYKMNKFYPQQPPTFFLLSKIKFLHDKFEWRKNLFEFYQKCLSVKVSCLQRERQGTENLQLIIKIQTTDLLTFWLRDEMVEPRIV